MRRFISSLLAMLTIVALGIMAPVRGAAPTTQPDLAAENARLKARVVELEAQVKTLTDLLHRGGHPAVRNFEFSLTPGPTSPRMPQGSVRKEFNGIEFYIVPLRSAPANTRLSVPTPVRRAEDLIETRPLPRGDDR